MMAAQDRVVIVPQEPGPVRQLSNVLHDDDLIDPLDEPADPRDRPGRADVLLLVTGVVLLVAGVAVQIESLITIGAISLVLGIALPLQAGIRAVRSRRMTSKTRRLLSRGYALDLSSREARALVSAYERVLSVADKAVTGRADESLARQAGEARAAAHRALVEAASLLAGRAPSVAPERTYLRKRIEALNVLAGALTNATSESVHAEGAEAGVELEAVAERAAAVALAREALDQEIGLGSLAQMAELTARLRKAPHDGDSGEPA